MTIVSGILVLAYGLAALFAPASLAPLGVAPAALLVLLGLHLTFAGLAQAQRRRAERKDTELKLKQSESEAQRLRQEVDGAQGQLVAATRREAEAGARVAALEKKNDALATQLAQSEAKEATPELLQGEIVSFLGLLQRKGRLIDFLMDDITQYPDPQVGAAGRVVHQGCRSVLEEYFDIVPIRSDSEGTAVTLDKDYSPARYRLVGHVTGHPPFKGRLLHRGWMATKVELPRVVASPDRPYPRDVIQPAEVELR